MLKTFRKKIDQSIASFMSRVEKDYKLHLVNPILYQSIREFSLREGKRIRPLLLVLSYRGYLPKGKKFPRSLYHASTCVEFLHNFMLIHDDIIDCSDLRRGKPTMHRLLAGTVPSPTPAKLGTDLAIIAGDIVYALAIDAFLSMKEDPQRKERALKYFVQTAAFTAMGEFIDTVSGVDDLANVSEKDVFLNYSLKTARYTFDCPLVTGAILAGAPPQEIRRLAEFGLLIGQAFQIQDDIIGIFETEKAIGKSILSDLEERKKTLLVVHAYRTLNGQDRAAFLKVFLKSRKTLADLETVKAIMRASGSLAYALDAVRSRVKKSRDILARLSIAPRYRALISESIFQLFLQSDAVAAANGIKEKAAH
jgi:geranylgeranyl diphosphate synthase type I